MGIKNLVSQPQSQMFGLLGQNHQWNEPRRNHFWLWSTAQQLLPDSNLPHETLIGSGDSSASSIIGESHTQQIALSEKVKSFRGLFG